MKEMVRFGGGIVGHEKWHGSMFWGKEKGREDFQSCEVIGFDFQNYVKALKKVNISQWIFFFFFFFFEKVSEILLKKHKIRLELIIQITR